jgi:hypothetical protein
VLPDLHKLLKFNKVREAEKVLIEQIEPYIIAKGNKAKKEKQNEWQKTIDKVRVSLL